MKRDFFRLNDVVTVHQSSLVLKTPKVKGRVICVNRKNKFGLEVVVLFETATDSEMIETFKQNGHRHMPSDGCHITLGWKE